MRVATALALLVLCGAAPVSAETMDATFGNTVTLAHPNGAVERYYFEPDGSVRINGLHGEVQGTWAVRGEDICLTVHGEENCSPLPAEKRVGESWPLETGGGTMTISIVEGR